MSATEIVKQLQGMSNAERLAVIETASRLIREDLSQVQGQAPAGGSEQERRMREAALSLKDLYAPGGELSEWTSLDAEEFADDYP